MVGTRIGLEPESDFRAGTDAERPFTLDMGSAGGDGDDEDNEVRGDKEEEEEEESEDNIEGDEACIELALGLLFIVTLLTTLAPSPLVVTDDEGEDENC